MMPGQFPQADLNKVKTFSIRKRKSKVDIKSFAQPPRKAISFSRFMDGLPHILVGNSFRAVVEAVVKAKKQHKPVLLMMGAHVIKCGLNPVLIELMKKKALTGLAMNGACAIHDTEIAFHGATSEEVREGLKDGSFGMVWETGAFIHQAIGQGEALEQGFGEALGRALLGARVPYHKLSLLAQASELKLPATVHVAIGTDIIHQHPLADGAAMGETSFRDFKIFCEQVARLNNGGVVLNIGSAVLMPEVFLKALTIARNLHGRVRNFTTVNFDMLRQYRPRVNVVTRPVAEGGQGFDITGHHELMVPLLAQAILEKL